MRRTMIMTFVSFFFLAVVAAGQGHGPIPKVSVTFPGLGGSTQVRPVPDSSTIEYAVIYVGSSSCRWSNLPTIPDAVRAIQDSVSKRAAAVGFAFATHGIARDVNAVAGIRHLDWVGSFDELSAGRSWLGSAVLRYMYSEHPGPASTPQVLIVQRQVTIANGDRRISEERVLRRLVSLDDMNRWVESGAWLPGISAVPVSQIERHD